MVYSMYVRKSGLKPHSFIFVCASYHANPNYQIVKSKVNLFHILPIEYTFHRNPLSAKLANLNFYLLEFVSRDRDPQLQAVKIIAIF